MIFNAAVLLGFLLVSIGFLALAGQALLAVLFWVAMEPMAFGFGSVVVGLVVIAVAGASDASRRAKRPRGMHGSQGSQIHGP